MVNDDEKVRHHHLLIHHPMKTANATENLTRVKGAISCIREDCESCDKSLQNLHKYV